MDDTTLFRVVLHLLVVFTEQLFATLISSGGNRRLPLAALNNHDFVVWTGHFGFSKNQRKWERLSARGKNDKEKPLLHGLLASM